MLFNSIFIDTQFYLGATNIAASAQTGANFALNFSQNFWSQIFSMGIFGRIAQVSLIIAGFGVIYRGYYFTKEIGSNSLDMEKVITSILTLIFVYLMLYNGGKLSMQTVMAMRNLGDGLGTQIMNGIAYDFQMLQATRTLIPVEAAQPHLATFKSELDKCAPKAKVECFDRALANLKQKVASNPAQDTLLNTKITDIEADLASLAASQSVAPATPSLSPSSSPSPSVTAEDERNVLQKIQDSASSMANALPAALSNAFDALVQLILTGLAIAFYLAIELTLLVFGFTLPINIGLSLFDPGPIKNWIGNFWLLVNAKLCFCIIVGIVVYLNLWAQSTSVGVMTFFVMAIQLLIAIYAPVLTFFYCQGSALALAGAMNSIASAPIRGAMGGMGRAAGALGGGMGAGIGKSVSRRLGGALSRAGAARGGLAGGLLSKAGAISRKYGAGVGKSIGSGGGVAGNVKGGARRTYKDLK